MKEDNNVRINAPNLQDVEKLLKKTKTESCRQYPITIVTDGITIEKLPFENARQEAFLLCQVAVQV